jgi:plasmid stabilization system protein ParE
MGLAIGAVTAEGRLHLVFRYRHPLFGPAETADIADRYLTALDQVATHAHDGPTSVDDRSAIQGCGLRASSPSGARQTGLMRPAARRTIRQ